MNTVYEITDQRNIERIKPLWLKLTEHHKQVSIYFKPRYESPKFETRKKILLAKSGIHPLHVQLATDKDTPVGYCVSSLTDEGEGEIDSIFVEHSMRGRGIGDTFMQRAIEWLNRLGAKRKIISVAGGNEQVFGFYSRYSFYPTAIQMAQTSGHAITEKERKYPDDLQISEAGIEELGIIEPLWLKLSHLEGDMSAKLREYFYHRSFAVKKADILKTAASGSFLLDLVNLLNSGLLVGYCISTIDRDKTGRIESIYLEPDIRGHGTGRRLFQRSLDWMDKMGIEKRTLWVVYENEPAIRFYQAFNFQTLNTRLIQVLARE